MDPIAYIQAGKDMLPYSGNGAMAGRGFERLGFEVKLFSRDELDRLPLTPDTVVVGGVATVREALTLINGRPPSPLTLPPVLYPYLGREVWRSTLGQIRAAGRFPVFLKPFEDAKVFDGQVLRSVEELDRLLVPRENFPQLTDDFPVLAQQPVKFLSEWRVFVLRQVVIGISYYKGDPLKFPSPQVIRLAIGSFDCPPAGYSADFGVTDDHQTQLVEINDGYSLGHGGLTATSYAELLLARWQELTTS